MILTNPQKSMKKILFLTFMVLIAGLTSKAQHRTCASHDINNMLLQNNPEYAAKRNAIEEHTERYIANPNKQRGVKTIPVVVHIVYKTAAQNLSDAAVFSQIEVLNRDFRKLNPDTSYTPAPFKGLAADCEFQFCLAQIDPNGNPTTGIVRVPTTVGPFTANDAVKFTSQGGDDAWDRNKYLNIWVCDIMGYLGYASFPGSAPEVDGVVISCAAFGVGGTSYPPYHLGRTATHEIGHWMNLYHIWGDDGTGCLGSDRVDDTPNQAGYNMNCPPFPKISCNNGPNGDMFMNYMDYGYDNCMTIFTEGQKARMSAVFAPGGFRWSLLSSNGCNTNSCGLADSLYATNITHTNASIGWKPVTDAVNYMFQYKLESDTAWTTIFQTANTFQFSNLTPLTSYNFRVLTQCNSGNSIFTNPYTFTTTAVPLPCNNPDSLYANVTSPTTATIGWRSALYALNYIVRYKAISNTNWITDTVLTLNDMVIDLTPTTTYEFQVQTVCANGYSIWSNLSSFSTPAIPIPCSNSYEPNNKRSSNLPLLPLNTTIGSMISASNDKDYYRIATSLEQPKLKVTLSNLPADYDIRLLNANGNQIGISENTGTQTEEIILNGTASATYYLFVYPASNSQFSSSACYHLSTNTSASNFRINEPYPVIGKGDFSNDDRVTITEDLKVTYDAALNDPVQLNILSVQGQRLNKFSAIATMEGKNTIFLPEMQMSSGIYFLEVITPENRKVEKFIIR